MKTFRCSSDDGQVVDYELQPWSVSVSIETVRKMMPVISPLLGMREGDTVEDLDMEKLVNSLADLLMREGDARFIKRLFDGVRRHNPETRKVDVVSEMLEVIYSGNLGEMLEALIEVLSINLAGPIKRLRSAMDSLDGPKK